MPHDRKCICVDIYRLLLHVPVVRNMDLLSITCPPSLAHSIVVPFSWLLAVMMSWEVYESLNIEIDLPVTKPIAPQVVFLLSPD